MAKFLADLPKIPNFDSSGDTSNLGIRWTRWLRSFELYAAGQGVTDAEQKKALLLHCAGLSVQDIFFTMTIADPTGDENVYTVIVAKLNAHFLPKVNKTYERSVFRSMTQLQSETIGQFITRLRQRAVYCEFGGNLEEMIRDQVIEKCYSHRLRRKLLETPNVTLVRVQELALSVENSERQARTMENHDSGTEAVNRVNRERPGREKVVLRLVQRKLEHVGRAEVRNISKKTHTVQLRKRNVIDVRI